MMRTLRVIDWEKFYHDIEIELLWTTDIIQVVHNNKVIYSLTRDMLMASHIDLIEYVLEDYLSFINSAKYFKVIPVERKLHA